MNRSYITLNSRIITFLIFSFFFTLANAQEIYTNVPSSITVCDDAENFTITIINETTSSFTNPKITVTLPEGFEYINNSSNEITSLNVQELNINNLDSPIFSSNTIPQGDSISFTIEAKATASAINFLSSGNIVQNNIVFLV